MSSIEKLPEARAITRFESLKYQIETAAQESVSKEFDYESASGNKAARSWIASLRKIKGSIEKARKEAKAVHLERGKAVDNAAKQLEADVLKLIEPHEERIKEIEAKELARIQAHRVTLDNITALADGVTTSAQAKERLAQVEAIDITGLEEFTEAGKSRKYDAEEKLHSLYDSLLQREAEQAELEALRAERAAQQKELKGLSRKAASEEAQQPKPLDVKPVPPVFREIREIEEASKRVTLLLALSRAMQGMTRDKVAAAIVDGTLHPAIVIDWEGFTP